MHTLMSVIHVWEYWLKTLQLFVVWLCRYFLLCKNPNKNKLKQFYQNIYERKMSQDYARKQFEQMLTEYIPESTVSDCS